MSEYPLCELFGVDLADVQSRLKFLGIGKADVARSKTLREIISENIDAILDAFYDHLTSFMDLAPFFVESQTVARLIRESDIIGRYGGEEFAVGLVEANHEAALQIADRARLNVARKPVERDGRRVSVTVSIGVATLADEESVDKLMERADKALYAAKNSGRNKVRAYPPEARPPADHVPSAPTAWGVNRASPTASFALK